VSGSTCVCVCVWVGGCGFLYGRWGRVQRSGRVLWHAPTSTGRKRKVSVRYLRDFHDMYVYLTCVCVCLRRRRALGWHLLAGKGKAEMDAQQWEADASERTGRISALEGELSSLQSQISAAADAAASAAAAAEARAAELQAAVTAAEASVAARAEELAASQRQLAGLQTDLGKAAASLSERESKVWMGWSSHHMSIIMLHLWCFGAGLSSHALHSVHPLSSPKNAHHHKTAIPQI
jgi:hypothetical protein